MLSKKKKGAKKKKGPEPEAAHLPVARTAWSTAAAQLKSWGRCHDILAAAATAYVPGVATSRLALVGDSITESWRGTSICRTMGRCRGVPDVLAETLGKRWPQPVVLGIAADHTQHLLWRLAHGELSSAMATDPKIISVLLIGTNNLGRGHSAAETLAGIDAVAERLLTGTRGRLLVNALLPRGDAAKRKYADTRVGTTPEGAPHRQSRPRSSALLTPAAAAALLRRPAHPIFRATHRQGERRAQPIRRAHAAAVCEPRRLRRLRRAVQARRQRAHRPDAGHAPPKRGGLPLVGRVPRAGHRGTGGVAFVSARWCVARTVATTGGQTAATPHWLAAAAAATAHGVGVCVPRAARRPAGGLTGVKRRSH